MTKIDELKNTKGKKKKKLELVNFYAFQTRQAKMDSEFSRIASHQYKHPLPHLTLPCFTLSLSFPDLIHHLRLSLPYFDSLYSTFSFKLKLVFPLRLYEKWQTSLSSQRANITEQKTQKVVHPECWNALNGLWIYIQAQKYLLFMWSSIEATQYCLQGLLKHCFSSSKVEK